jgi:adenosine deaminase
LKTAHEAFLAGLPKAELHLHIEGTLTPAQKWRIAARNGIDLPYASAAEIPAAQDFRGGDPASFLRSFLDFYYEGLRILRTARDFRDVVFDHLATCRDENVRYVEISFDPQPHRARGIAFAEIMEGLQAGIDDGRGLGVEAQLIMCINRDLPLESALATLDEARAHRDRIVGLGLDSNEEGNPPEKFRTLYARARDEGYRLTAHCDVDQRDAAAHIRDCLHVLGVERIDHGINCLEDEALISELRDRDICLTACPTWRPSDAAPRRMDRIPVMHRRGLSVCINSDDPGLFASGTLGAMLPAVAAAGAFTEDDLAQLMINAFRGAWLPAERRAAYIAEIRAYRAAWPDGGRPPP